MRDTSGTSSVEFALVLPLLLIIVLGLIETGSLILSYAGMNSTMSLVQEVAKTAPSSKSLELRLDEIAQKKLGFGFTKISFDNVVQFCICPLDAAFGMDRRTTCPMKCSGGEKAMTMFDVKGNVIMPSFLPGGSRPGWQTLEVKLTVLGQ